MRRVSLLLVASLSLLLLTAPSDAVAKKTVIGDMNSPWFHIGGGPGLNVNGSNGEGFGGRFTVGGGLYAIMFMGGGQFELSANSSLPLSVSGVGILGITIPIPVFHPFFAFKAGGGMASDGFDIGPELKLGGTLGFIIRKFDGKPGFRLAVEPSYLISPVYFAGFETYVTFSLVL